MSYLAPSEFVSKMVDAGESKLLMSTKDTLIRAYMAGAILALVVLFLAGFLLVRIIGDRISTGTKSSLVGPIDRVLGLGFGAAKGVLAAALIFLMTNLVFDTIDPGEPSPEWLAKARTAPTLAMISKSLVDFVGEHARIAPDSAALDAARNAGMPRDDIHDPLRTEDADGYAPGQREALDQLLDRQEKAAPSTPI